MRTRMVRVRRRKGGVIWAVVLLIVVMAVYVRVSLPMMSKYWQISGETLISGTRVTQEICLEGIEIHLICFGEWASESEAYIEAGRYVPRGAAGYVMKGEQGFCVIGAMYENSLQAEQVCARLHSAEGLLCTVRKAGASPLTVRMTAMDTQIEAFSQAEKMLRETWRALSPLALAIDRREADWQQAQAVIYTHSERLRTAQMALKESSGTEQALFASLDALMGEVIAQMARLTTTKETMSLSAGLKYCSIDAALRHAAWMEGIE